MKKIALISLLFIIGSGIYSQENRTPKFGINYHLIINKTPIFNIYSGAVDYRFTNNINFFLIRERLNKSKILYGLSYQYIYGDSEVKTYETYSCSGSGLITFSKYFEKKQNVFQLYFGYQFKPLNKRENIYLRCFVQPGFSIETSFSHYNPEIGCQGYFNVKEKYWNLAFSGGVSGINQIFSNKKIALNLNYGIIYQWIDLSLLQINPFAGIELQF